jgi:DNA repair exonuclease SbcCD ATPase subunit
VVIYRRAVFEAVGGFNTSVNPSADYEMYLRVARRYPVCHHTEVVAQYRHHDENMSGDRARMLKYSIGVLRSQREHIKGRKLYEEAYRAGLRWERGRFGDPLVAEVKAQLKEGEWVRALQGVVALVRYHPQGAALLVLNERRMKRRILARRLQARKQELEPVERRLKELEEGSTRPEEKGWEDAVAEERQKAQRLREGIQRLERRIRNLEDRRARKGRSGKVRRLFERLRRAREKASRR